MPQVLTKLRAGQAKLNIAPHAEVCTAPARRNRDRLTSMFAPALQIIAARSFVLEHLDRVGSNELTGWPEFAARLDRVFATLCEQSTQIYADPADCLAE
jgi:hypothetical protein